MDSSDLQNVMFKSLSRALTKCIAERSASCDGGHRIESDDCRSLTALLVSDRVMRFSKIKRNEIIEHRGTHCFVIPSLLVILESIDGVL